MYDYEISFSPRRTRLSLTLNPDGGLAVRAPTGTPRAVVERFLAAHADWIEKHRQRLAALELPEPHRFLPGEKFYYLGEQFRLEFVPFPGARARLRPGVIQTSAATPEEAARQLERFYRARTRELLGAKTARLAAQLGVEIRRLSVTAAGTRWGSCSSRHTLNFPWNLVMCPEEAVDYVAAHEVAHLVHLNHSPAFWQLVQQLCPEWREQDRFLKTEGRFFQSWPGVPTPSGEPD